jgi:hypothetical protein
MPGTAPRRWPRPAPQCGPRPRAAPPQPVVIAPARAQLIPVQVSCPTRSGLRRDARRALPRSRQHRRAIPGKQHRAGLHHRARAVPRSGLRHRSSKAARHAQPRRAAAGRAPSPPPGYRECLDRRPTQPLSRHPHRGGRRADAHGLDRHRAAPARACGLAASAARAHVLKAQPVLVADERVLRAVRASGRPRSGSGRFRPRRRAHRHRPRSTGAPRRKRSTRPRPARGRHPAEERHGVVVAAPLPAGRPSSGAGRSPSAPHPTGASASGPAHRGAHPRPAGSPPAHRGFRGPRPARRWPR